MITKTQLDEPGCPEIEQRLAFARALAREAGALTLRHFGGAIDVSFKADQSPVTVADREAETLMRARLAEHYPEDGVVGEEFGESNPESPGRWIIDPIDGTKSFVRGVPLYGVLIGFEYRGRAAVGVIHLPALSETVSAATGLGCWHDDARARVSACAAIDDALLLTTDEAAIAEYGHQAAWDALTETAGMVRTWGDCYGHALVATGRAEFMFDPVVALWDAAALQPIIEEAGGVFTDFEGRRTHRGRSALASNAALAGTIREQLGAGTTSPAEEADC